MGLQYEFIYIIDLKKTILTGKERAGESLFENKKLNSTTRL